MIISDATITAIIGALALIFKGPFEKLLTKLSIYLSDKIPFIKKRRLIKKDSFNDAQIDKLIAGIGERYQFNRVTVTQFSKYKVLPVTAEEFAKMELTVTHEWTDNVTNSIQSQFQNYSCEIFADGLVRLHDSKEGYILINAETDVQNIWGVVSSYRFKIGQHLVHGSLALSFTREGDIIEMSEYDIQHIKNVAKQIYFIIHKKK